MLGTNQMRHLVHVMNMSADILRDMGELNPESREDLEALAEQTIAISEKLLKIAEEGVVP